MAGRYSKEKPKKQYLVAIHREYQSPRKTDGQRKLMIYGEAMNNFVSYQSPSRPDV
jgi:hypothetical protein